MVFGGLTIPDVSAADWDNPLAVSLAVCQEAQDEALTSDGSNICTVPLYSKFVGMKLDLRIIGATSTVNVYRWLLHKLPDGEELITDANRLTNTGFHVNTDDSAIRESRKFQMAKGMVITNPSSAISGLRVFVRRAAMKRVGSMREGDVIRLDIAKDTAGTTSLLHGFGTLYFKTA